MELFFQSSSGIPEGSILSVQAGDQRKQRLLNDKANEKPWYFPARPLQANPFRLDVYAPFGSSRLALKPLDQQYTVELKPTNGAAEAIKLEFAVKELPSDATPLVSPNGNGSEKSESRQQRKQKAASEAQNYIEKHQLMQYVQNMMQSVLTEKPDDPFAYMENLLRQTRGQKKVDAGAVKEKPKEAPANPKARKVRPPKENLKPIPKETQGTAWVKINATSQEVESKRMLAPSDVMQPGSQIRRLKIHHLTETFPGRMVETPFKLVTSNFQDDRSWVTQVLETSGKPRMYYQMLSAGPREFLHFDPKEVVATIVACGGLSPGLNAVVRELVMLLYAYGVKKVWGVIGGFGGICTPEKWLELTPDDVQDIHQLGGTILVSDRADQSLDEQLQCLKSMNVRMHFIIGGDGTHRGAWDMYSLMQKEQYECSVVGIPKTVDNNIPMLDRTFGFDTACAEAEKAINAAYTEATGNANCIGLVKLMGRDCGFITMNACLAARQVDICLLPEMQISIEKVLLHCIHLMQTKGQCVIVIAEGCKNAFYRNTGDSPGDPSEKIELKDVGPWLKEQILAKFEDVKLPLTIKYIDPTYMVRAVKPNANDGVYCAILAQNAVHAALAGYTGISIGRVQMNFVMLPIQAVAMQKSRQVDLKGAHFMQILALTFQADFTPDDIINSKTAEVMDSPPANPLEDISMTVELKSVLGRNDEVRRLELDHLKYHFGHKEMPTTLVETVVGGDLGFVEEDSWATQTMKMSGGGSSGKVCLQMVRAGPRRTLYHDPKEVAAAIITCGGLCPGLNTVIREVVMTLYSYGVKKVYGIKGGYKGVVHPETWMTLTPEVVQDIHDLGGTILVTDRGNPTEEEQVPFLIQKGIKNYFIIGGDGTHLGAMDMYDLMRDMGWECSVIGIPKSIDNDIPLLDRTFGFDTAMTEAGNAIDTAYVESKCNANCIGLVKLMGRHCGLLSMFSVVAARHVAICLLPEMNVCLSKVLEECVSLLDTRGSAVVVVAEGCAESLMKGIPDEYDAGGNKKIPDVGIWLKDAILDHFKQLAKPLTIKYVDPTYMVRAVKSNANDSIYSASLARHAVHAAMTGYSGVTVARMDEQFVYLPIKVLCSQPSKTVDLTGRWFERLLLSTRQPNFDPNAPEGHGSIRARRLRPTATFFAADGKADVLWVPETKLSFYDGYGKLMQQRALERGDLLRTMDDIRDLKCQHLSETYGQQKIPSTLKTPSNCTPQDAHSWVTQAFHGAGGESVGGAHYYRMVRAGPRKFLHFDPYDPASAAAIVSCGGICPGLNCVIRELVMTLWAYGVRKIWGVVGGYKGVMEPENWLKLTPDMVQDIHLDGGTMLISDRGNPPHIEMAKVLKRMNVRQYFVLGGDGSHKGAMQTFDEMPGIGHECSVVGVPKTIDNDVPLLDQTFGFDTACTEAVRSVDSAYIEARCNKDCIGLVKLMGRHCGFIAMNATLAARHVDICLLPEMHIDTRKVLAHAGHLMATKGYAVILVAEGCGDTMIKSDDSAKDAGGNKILKDVGPWLKEQLESFFKAKGTKLAVRYIDPTYMIRSIPANAYDNAYCSALAQNAVHGAMAGYTGITVGKIYERHVYLPIHAITKQPGRRVNTNGRWFQRLMETTRQPDFRPNDEDMRMGTAFSTVQTSIMTRLSSPSSINNVLQMGDEIRRLELVNLKDMFTSAECKSPLFSSQADGDSRMFVPDTAWSTQTFSRKDRHDDTGHIYYQTLSGGPRELLFSDPAKGRAVIVTCGGLCPGLNSVIRELVITLINYGVKKIYGCIGGYKSMVTPENWIELTKDVVQNIHKQGGTILVSDRGNPPHCEIAASLKNMGITNYFVIGGDGTHAGAMDTFTETQKLNYPCTVVGVPKTIDNDIVVLDRTFGFNTACTEAVKAINSAYVEVTCGVGVCGLIRLMGRSCGFIAMEAVLAARHVDICLIPEMDISLPKLLTYALEVMDRKGHAMIVVAEGCGDTLIKSSSGETDAGGNKKLADVGPWLKDELELHFAKMTRPYRVKYTDPTYTIRAVPANANDAVYCSVLAQHAVHGAMAGYSGITVGKVDERYVMIPIHAIARKNRKIPLDGRVFERLMTTTGQRRLAPGRGDEWKLMPPYPKADPYQVVPWERIGEPSRIWWKGVEPPRPFSPPSSPRELPPPPGVVFKQFTGTGDLLEERPLKANDIFDEEADVRRVVVLKLSDKYGVKKYPTPLRDIGVTFFYDEHAWSVESPCTTGLPRTTAEPDPYLQVVRAGPRENLHFNPADNLSAAIVTAGSLCPGENVAIREIVLTLLKYNVSQVFGVSGGFRGIIDTAGWKLLNEVLVRDIHNKGGTILSSQPGHPDPLEAAKALKEKDIRLFFILGGDGSHHYLQHVQASLIEIDHECAVMGIPATIDNDIPKADTCFGFDTAIYEAKQSVDCAYVEATCNANCIGLVKLAGNRSGNLALMVALATCRVDICLLPEMEIKLDKVLSYCEKVMETKKFAVIVVSEGCNASFLDHGEEPGYNVGPWLRDQIMQYFKSKAKPLTIKYIDPVTMIQTVKANAADSVYCHAVSENAVHGAMAGYTGVSSVKRNCRYIYMPVQVISRCPPKRVNLHGYWFGRMVFATGQPDFSRAKFSKRVSTLSPIPDKLPALGDLTDITQKIDLSDLLGPGAQVHRLDCLKLFKDDAPKTIENPTAASGLVMTEENSYTLQALQRSNGDDKCDRTYVQFLRSGPRAFIHLDPKTPGACAAIVTAGGLCPGLNTVIREVVRMLFAYGVEKVYGIRGGYKGCVEDDKWIELTPDYIQDIHMQGGTVLISDRGNPPHIEIAKTLQRRNVRWYFVLGGDGTHKGATQTFDEMPGIGHECAVCGVPKTIDNDIQRVDQTFGFDTAVTEANRAIDSAYVEATTNANCIGLVKLMGRHCGWVAATATLAARHVDICLIPEMDISLGKVLEHVVRVMKSKRYMVIVIAEGCGDTLLTASGSVDAGGNKVLPDVGPWLKDSIIAHCKKEAVPVTIKYIDPTYMIRSVAADAFDNMYCSVLAQEAVHGAMAGYTCFTVGKVDEAYSMIPIHAICGKGQRKMAVNSRVFGRLLATTQQPSFAP